MCVLIRYHSVRCVLLILLVRFGSTLQVSAKMNITNIPIIKSANISVTLPSSLINSTVHNVRGSDVDFSFDDLQENLMDFLGQNHNGNEDDCNDDHHTNCSDVEYRTKKNGTYDLGGRNKMANMFKLARGVYKKHVGTLLLAYKLKFFTLFPLLVAAMMIIVKASGLAGFFFALFIGSVAVKSLHR